MTTKYNWILFKTPPTNIKTGTPPPLGDPVGRMSWSTVHPMTRAGLQSTYLTGSGSVVPSWLLFHISFMLKSKMKEKRLDAWQNFNYLSMMWAASFLNQIYKHYPVLEKYFLNFLCYLQCYNYREDTCISLICIMELFSTTFFFFFFSYHFLKSNSAAAAAKSLQLCLTLCDPRDGSPPGSPLPGILQARTPVGCHFLLQTITKKQLSIKPWFVAFASSQGDWFHIINVHGPSLNLKQSQHCLLIGYTPRQNKKVKKERQLPPSNGNIWQWLKREGREENLLSHLSCVQLFATPWTVARQASLSMGFSRQEYWRG